MNTSAEYNISSVHNPRLIMLDCSLIALLYCKSPWWYSPRSSFVLPKQMQDKADRALSRSSFLLGSVTQLLNKTYQESIPAIFSMWLGKYVSRNDEESWARITGLALGALGNTNSCARREYWSECVDRCVSLSKTSGCADAWCTKIRVSTYPRHSIPRLMHRAHLGFCSSHWKLNWDESRVSRSSRSLTLSLRFLHVLQPPDVQGLPPIITRNLGPRAHELSCLDREWLRIDIFEQSRKPDAWHLGNCFFGIPAFWCLKIAGTLSQEWVGPHLSWIAIMWLRGEMPGS
jgi:hypothetical protein